MMDFAENFLCKFQDKPQSADWAYKQVTVFPGWEQLVTRLVLKVSIRSVTPDESPAGSLEWEVMSVLQNRSYRGLWEFLAASYVLKRPILSVFPPLGWELYRVHCSRIIRAPGCNMDQKDCHHVVVSEIRSCPRALDTQSFCSHCSVKDWAGSLKERHLPYGAMAATRWAVTVLEIACILFFHQKHGTQLFSAPARPDYSWEPFSSFRIEVQLHFKPEAASRRCQFFTIYWTFPALDPAVGYCGCGRSPGLSVWCGYISFCALPTVT